MTSKDFPTPWFLGFRFTTVENIERQQVLCEEDHNGFRMCVLEANPEVCRLIVEAVNAYVGGVNDV